MVNENKELLQSRDSKIGCPDTQNGFINVLGNHTVTITKKKKNQVVRGQLNFFALE
jgi:hypothetical protein